MGRSPCCDKVGLKKGPWTPEEDQKLLTYIEEHDHGSWRALPSKAGLQRCGKSCRLRWINYLRPDIKRGKFSPQEEQTIIQLHALLGNRWSAIATHLSKRTDNEIKNYWNTHLKKRLAKMGIDPVSHKPKNDTLLSNDGYSKSTANMSHMAQWESARLEAEARLVKESKLRSTSPLPSQVSIIEPSPTSTKLLGSVSEPPPRCLDMVTTWNGVWGNKPSDVGDRNGIGDLESPTSTLSTVGLGENSTNFFKLAGVGSLRSQDERTVGEQFEDGWEYKDGNGMENSIPFTPGFNDLTMPVKSSKSYNNMTEHVQGDNFLESFTDLLLCNSNSIDHSNLASVDGDSNTSLACGGKNNGPGGNNACYDWDHILNLVNSSPSHSLMF